MPAPRTSSRTSPSGQVKRPALSARETAVLREALALRARAAAGETLTAAQLELVRSAAGLAARTGRSPAAPRPRASVKGRPPARRTARKKPAARRAAAGRRDRPRASWRTRIGVVAMSTLLMPAAAAMTLSGSPDGGVGGTDDVTTLALAAQSTLLAQAGQYRQLEQELSRRTDELEQARLAEEAAQLRVDAARVAVGSRAAELYTSAPVERYPLLGLDVRNASGTSDVLFHQAVADRADRDLERTVVRAERTVAALETATARVATAAAAVEEVSARAAQVLAEVRDEIGGLGTAVTARLAGLGAPVGGAAQARNQQAMARWQTYLARLDDAGIGLPTAAELSDATQLPMGLSPALDADRRPVPGIAWAVIGSSPVTVLPAETVAAVSTALSQLGKPFAPATTGPETYDCGGLAASAWLLAGYALPTNPQEQWAVGAPVPAAQLNTGDLVFSPGGRDVGIYLGDGDVLSASAATGQVGVRDLVPGSSATRVTLPTPAASNPPLPLDGRAGNCGAVPPPPGKAPSPAWGGYANGRIPGDALCELGVYRHALRCDAAHSYKLMSEAFQEAFGSRLCITDSYRSYASQVSAYARKPALAAWPGTSNHGWALAVDLCGGINVAGSPQWNWMVANAGRFGWVQPTWAAPGGEKPEPWHWEYGYIS
ncbi:NlpC/P60 family protein [Blastococcus sp. PRF04-17]|uniref:NlpC/P60 family protein n=1 Tax=Blastococcus sp. PRF04-17 TaxID=2933797 RepID=UPI001FF15551|nr:NlpC/P60 family protein [Blastococcus sp. PRF04-17]UOY03900.1 NlpC/P60 family protein [Blastococcus sp. PRF04-17]